MMKKVLAIGLVGVMMVSMTACGGDSSEESAAPAEEAAPADAAEEAAEAVENAVGDGAKEGGYMIGYSPYTLKNEYFTAVLNGVQTACDELGCELVYFDPQNDPTKQASQIDDMIASGIDALIYLPYDAGGARTVLQTCRDAGVKVINIDNVVTEADYDLVDGILASDNMQLGELAGEWVAENHPDGANILICHLQVAESCVINVEGFWKGIKDNVENPDDFVEVQVVEGGGDTEVTFSAVADVLQAHDEINVIYCINDTSALGAVQAVEDAGLTGKIDIIGKDGAPIGKQAIKDGKMVQSSAQRPTYMGYTGVQEAVALLNGEEIEFNVSIPCYSITKDNIDEFDVNAWDALD